MKLDDDRPLVLVDSWERCLTSDARCVLAVYCKESDVESVSTVVKRSRRSKLLHADKTVAPIHPEQHHLRRRLEDGCCSPFRAELALFHPSSKQPA